ncbi:unnamed protein product [Sphagnum troendelagicum]
MRLMTIVMRFVGWWQHHDRSMHVRGERKKEQLHHHLLPSRREHPGGRRLIGRVWWAPRPLQQQQLLPGGWLPQVPRSTKTFAGNPDDITDKSHAKGASPKP